MPRFFFDIHDGSDFVDEQGLALPSLAAAKTEALRALAELAKDVVPTNGPRKEITIVIRSETGAPVLTVTSTFAVDPPI